MDTMSKDSGLGYVPPTSAEVRDMLERMQLSNEDAGKPVAISGRQMRRYTSEGSEKSSMPFAILYTLVHRLYGCALTPENWRNELVIQPKDAGGLKGLTLVSSDESGKNT